MKMNYTEKETLNINDIKQILGIGFNSAYKIVQEHEKYNFHVVKIGRKYLIPKKQFFQAFHLD